MSSSLPLLALKCLLLIPFQSMAMAAYKDYKNYQVFELTANSEMQQAQLLTLSQQTKYYDFLGVHRSVSNSTARVMVAPSHVQKLLTHIKSAELQYNLLVKDVAPLFTIYRNEHQEARAKVQSITPQLDVFAAFYTHAEINEYLDSLAKAYPRRAFVKTFGRTYEKRELKIITITKGDGRSGKKVILIDATVHAREWIGTSMALFIIKELLENYEAHDYLLEDYDWVIMPVVNADGYEYTHTDERFWRKTRKPTKNASCVGTDLNRNFGYKWGLDEGSSADPCEEIYRGSRPFSEPEAIVLRDVMLNYEGRLKYYLSLHSYGRYILLPWGYTKTLAENYNAMMEVTDAGAMAILHATNSIYSYGSGAHVLYETSGDTADYAVGSLNVPIAMTMELPAGGFYGFDVFVRQIEDMVKETWVGILAMATKVVETY